MSLASLLVFAPPTGAQTTTAATLPAHSGAGSSASPTPMTCARGIEVREVPDWREGGWGSTRRGYSIVQANDVTRIFYVSADTWPTLQTTTVTANGRFAPAFDAGARLGSRGHVGDARFAVSGTTTTLVASVYRTDRDADVAFATVEPDGRVSAPRFIDPDAATEHDPVIAAGADGHLAVAWTRGPHPSADAIEFALVDATGLVLARRTIARGIRTNALALVSAGAEYMLIYAPENPTNFIPYELTALTLASNGSERARTTLAHGAADLPAAAWDGEGVGIAYSLDPSRLVFMRVAPDGTALTLPHDIGGDSSSRGVYRAEQMTYAHGLFWIGTSWSDRGRDDSVAPNHARAVAVARDGTVRASEVLPNGLAENAFGPAFVETANGVRGVYVSRQREGRSTVRVFDAMCR